MDEMGMSDLQFKSFLKRIVAELEEATEAETKEESDAKLKALMDDLKADIAS